MSSSKLFRSKKIFLLIIIFFYGYSTNSYASCDTQSDISRSECETLVNLYQSTGGANWKNNSNWLNNSPCSWYGIECGNGSITRLLLADNGLSGTIASLSSLTNLYWLNLDFNQLTGSVPNLSGLSNLSGADLTGNQFSGELPAFSHLPNLSYLNLSYNNLSGSLPESLARLLSLKTFLIKSNQITGQLPQAFSSSSINAFTFDTDKLCIESNLVADWLKTIEEPVTSYNFCLNLVSETSDSLLTTGDTLHLLTRIQDVNLSEPLNMDFYLSLILPDQQTEYFLTGQNGNIQLTEGGTNSANWTPLVSNYLFSQKSDSGLLPIYSYTFGAAEPSGQYTWQIRATAPGTKNILYEDNSYFYFNPSRIDLTISAPKQAFVSENVSFQLTAKNNPSNIIYHWSFDDGTTATGKQISRRFDSPDRYLVKVTAEINGEIIATAAYHHINIGRSIEDTIYPKRGSDFLPSSTESSDFSWNECDPNWNVYYGKYFKIWLEADLDNGIQRQQIINGLLFADYLFEAYSEIFTWDYLPSTPALDIYFCDNIEGGGTGTGGTFLHIEGISGASTEAITPGKDFTSFVHEFVHAWDFRGGAWLNSEDTAHAFTGGMEPIISYILGTGQGISSWGGDYDALSAFSPNFLFNHYFRVELNRYLKHPELNWSSYYTEEFQSLDYQDEHIPENKEALLVQGGLLMSLFNMHGLEGLQNIFSEVEKLTLQHPEWNVNPGYHIDSQLTRSENFMKAVADALQLDVSDYFAYWKYPIAGLDAYMTRYPVSEKIMDNDDDGFSSLQGDRDDNDSSVYPYAPELVDGKDNNQDGLVDENVYIEAIADIGLTSISLPATITATISDLNDTDSFQFTLASAADISIIMYSVDSKTKVKYSPESQRDISIFAGTIYLNGLPYSELVHSAMSAPEALSAKRLPAGTHTLSVSTSNLDGRNPNPGEYEIQLFVNDYEKVFQVDELLKLLYP